MACLDSLPNELLARIIAFSDRRSLAQLRVTNRKLEDIAVRKLFEKVTLYAHWVEDNDESLDRRAYCDPFDPFDDSDSESFVAPRRSARPSEHDLDDDFIAASDLDEEDLSESNEHHAKEEESEPTGEEEDPRSLLARLRPQFFDQHEHDQHEHDQHEHDQHEHDQHEHDQHEHEMQRRHEWENARPMWARANFPGPPDYNAIVFRNIIESDKLKRYVRQVQIYTCEAHCDHHPKEGARLYEDSWPEPAFHPIYIECIERLGEFPNLNGLTVHFDRHAAGYHDEGILQEKNFQNRWLEIIMQYTPATVSDLAVRHFQTPHVPEVVEAQALGFLNRVATASSLRLSMKHFEEHPAVGTTYRIGQIHQYWEAFPSRVLLPASATLTTLILYSDIPLGWFPKLDLRNVRLPKLASLTLGHHIFHHSRQIDWIASHAATLRTLILDHCAILYQIGCCIPNWLDSDGYPTAQDSNAPSLDYGISPDPYGYDDPAEFARNLSFTSHTLRWHTVFARFASSLPHLREFRFGSSPQWNFDTTTMHFRAGAVTHMPIMPWEDEHDIESGLFERMYVIWDDWENEYRSRWLEQRWRGGFGEGWGKEWFARLEEYPGCGEDDGEGLKVLLEEVRGR